MKKTTLLALATVLASGTALAQTEGSILIRGGMMQIKPKVESGSLTGPAPSGSTIDNGPSTRASGGVTLVLTRHLSIDTPLAPPFKFPIYGTGAVQGVGQLASVKSLPATVFLQYRMFEPSAKFRPYIGLGVTYAKFFGEEGSAAFTGLTNPGGPATRFKVESKFAVTPQIGLYYEFSDPYFFDIWYGKTFLKTRTTLSTGQTQDLTLNPRTLQISLGIRI